ncbi:MAG: tetratricopeptide repeat protein [Deltaproteobacteria bacterium]|nr:tetratricopeptide repeat protein [Deltaproteobacteria bacterium]
MLVWLCVLLAAASTCEAELQAVREASERFESERAKLGPGSAPLEMGPAARELERSAERFLRSCPAHPEQISVRYSLGRLFYQHNRFEPALAIFEQIISTSPEHPLAEYAANLSLDVLHMQGDLAGLERLLRRYQKNAALMRRRELRESLDKILPGVLLRRADQELTAAREPGAVRKAAERFLAVADGFPAHPLADAALYNAALAFERAGDAGRARAARLRLLRSHPKSDLAARVRKQLGGE